MINRTSLAMLVMGFLVENTCAQQVQFDRINPPGEHRMFASYLSSVVTSPSTNPPPQGLANSNSDPVDTGALNPGQITINDWLLNENQEVVATTFAKSHARLAHARLDGLVVAWADTESIYDAISNWAGASQMADARAETSARFHDSWKRSPESPQGLVDVFSRVSVSASVAPNFVGIKVYGDYSRCDVSAPGLMGIVRCRCLPIALEGGGTADTFVLVQVRWCEKQPDGSFIWKEVNDTREGETSYVRWWFGAMQGTLPETDLEIHGWSRSNATTNNLGVAAHPQNNPHHKDSTLKARVSSLGPSVSPPWAGEPPP